MHIFLMFDFIFVENDVQFEAETGNHVRILFWSGHKNIPFREVIFVFLFFNPSHFKITNGINCSRAMQQSGDWPTDMRYISCNDFDGTNSPVRDIDLRTAFVNVRDTPIYGNFTFPPANMPFNGFSWMRFKMDISAISVQSGTTVSVKPLGTWMADISAPIQVNSIDEMSDLTAAQVYRVGTVVVSVFFFLVGIFAVGQWIDSHLINCSKRHLSWETQMHRRVSKATASICLMKSPSWLISIMSFRKWQTRESAKWTRTAIGVVL